MKTNVLIERKKSTGNSQESEMFRNRISIKEPSDNIIYKIADTSQELEQAYKLVHDVYLKMGFMNIDPSGMRLSKYNAMPSTHTFIAKLNNEVVMTLTLFADSFIGLPLDCEYKEELQFLRDEGRYIGEIGANASIMHNQNVVFHMFKMVFNYAKNYQLLDDIVVSLRPKHALFYTHVYGFEQIGGLKTYSSANGNPAVLYRVNLHNLSKFCQMSYPRVPVEKDLHYFMFRKRIKSIKLPRIKTDVNIWNSELIKYFFMLRTNIFKEINSDEAKHFEVIYDNLKVS
jgi:hypothetical protein